MGRDAAAEVLNYEQIRDQTIKANKERMQQLGLFDLNNNNSKPSAASKRARRDPPPPSPSRRSFRLKTMAPVSYVEIKQPKGKRGSTWDGEIRIKEGERAEIYTEEEERLLGDCNKTWELAVDGYGEDRKRIYDPVKGETCHQCRQKTLGQHTHCCQCDLVQGQLCGDCLYMRYGENVMEANKNPAWVCPVCRGICNCSLCRKEKGWEPTGNLYRKVINLGYKSVAHYLIQTRRSQPKSETLGTEESMENDMKEETEDGQVAGERKTDEVQPVAAKDKGKNGTAARVAVRNKGKNDTTPGVAARNKGKNGTAPEVAARKKGKNGTALEVAARKKGKNGAAPGVAGDSVKSEKTEKLRRMSSRLRKT